MPKVTNDAWNELFLVFAIMTLCLLVKTTAAIMMAANPSNHPQEDYDIGIMKKDQPVPDKRLERSAANDLENIPFHYGIFAMALVIQNAANTSSLSNKKENGLVETRLLTAIFICYTIFRYIYSVSYFFSLQPWRTLSFVGSLVCVLITACLMVASATQINMCPSYSGMSAC